MVRAKPDLPSGHGELLLRPAFEEWSSIARSNRAAADAWGFEIAGVPIGEVRSVGRHDSAETARLYAARLGFDVSERDPEGIVVGAGHQPELYHTGIWAKVFLLQRLADELGALAFDLVVDTDGFDRVGITVPCFGGPRVERCHVDLVRGGTDTCFACTPAPDSAAVADFCTSTSSMLATLPAPSPGTHFSSFCRELTESASVAQNLAELVTSARRRYERSVGSRYCELPASSLGDSDMFLRFVVSIALDAERFRDAYNEELRSYREANGIRSTAQPVPDLEVSDAGIELPFWALEGVHRHTLLVQKDGTRATLVAGATRVSVSGGSDVAGAIRASGLRIGPKALALTAYARLVLTDLFIHGVGGGRYDRVTDGIIRSYFGVEPPAFVVASLTMFLPLGAHVVTDAEVQSATERLNRFEHNPDTLIRDADFENADERDAALALARDKAAAVAAMNEPNADKKALGLRIRELNGRLRDLLAPLGEVLAAEKRNLEAQRASADVLTDRTYPFCFWAPEDVADKVR